MLWEAKSANRYITWFFILFFTFFIINFFTHIWKTIIFAYLLIGLMLWNFYTHLLGHYLTISFLSKLIRQKKINRTEQTQSFVSGRLLKSSDAGDSKKIKFLTAKSANKRSVNYQKTNTSDVQWNLGIRI